MLPPDSTEADREVALVAKALAHPTRVRILRILLARATCTCGEIVDALPLAQATVSQHLKVLKEAGLVKGEIDGPRVCYCADQDRLHWFNQVLGTLTQAPAHSEMEVIR
jgi:ArsR family transcriptional regulator